MRDELKSCPFCGKQPKLDVPEIRSGSAWAYIRCDSYCGVKPMASGSADTHYYDKPFGEEGKYVEYRSEAEAKDFALNLAKERWNTRAAACCTPTAEEKALLAAGDCTPEELWGGSRPTCPKCV